jgi:hypothetical protein
VIRSCLNAAPVGVGGSTQSLHLSTQESIFRFHGVKTPREVVKEF